MISQLRMKWRYEKSIFFPSLRKNRLPDFSSKRFLISRPPGHIGMLHTLLCHGDHLWVRIPHWRQTIPKRWNIGKLRKVGLIRKSFIWRFDFLFYIEKVASIMIAISILNEASQAFPFPYRTGLQNTCFQFLLLQDGIVQSGHCNRNPLLFWLRSQTRDFSVGTA